MKAADTVMNDPRGKEAVATAVGLAQKGKEKLEEAQAALLKAAGVPGREEYQELAKQLARIKRKARELSEQLAADAADAADEEQDHPRSNGKGPAKPR
ncbi:MAG: hypothetical protein QM704_19435 [Anaeromyxobacteraceae bacterium]